FVVLKFNFFFILSTVLISNFLSILLMLFLASKNIKINLNFNRELGISLLKSSIPIGIAGFLSITYFKMDTIMLSVFKNAKDVGIYTLSYKIFENVVILWTFYIASFFPFLSRFYHEKEWDKYHNLIRNGTVTALLLFIFVMFFGNVFAPLAVKVFGGDLFYQSILPLRILLFSSFFFFINAIIYNVLFITKRINFIIISLLAA